MNERGGQRGQKRRKDTGKKSRANGAGERRRWQGRMDKREEQKGSENRIS